MKANPFTVVYDQKGFLASGCTGRNANFTRVQIVSILHNFDQSVERLDIELLSTDVCPF